MPRSLEDPLSDPVVKAAVDQAMEPYRGLVTPEVLEEMREDLADYLLMHPVTDRLVRRLRTRTNVASGAEAKDGAAPEAKAPVAKRKGAGG
jgi:hypothetical protein